MTWYFIWRFFRILCCVFDIMFTFLLCKNLASVGKSGGLENCTVDWLTGGVNEEVRWTLNTHHIQHIPDYLDGLFGCIPHYWQLYSVIHWINLNFLSSIYLFFLFGAYFISHKTLCRPVRRMVNGNYEGANFSNPSLFLQPGRRFLRGNCGIPSPPSLSISVHQP